MRTTSSSPLLAGALVALLAAPAALATEPLALTLAPGGRHEISLSGQSTLHPFTSRSSTFQLTGALARADGEHGKASTVAAIERGAVSVDVKVPVRSLKSGKRELDAMLHKTLKGAQYPLIHFQLQTTRATPDGNDIYKLKARGILTVAGVDREIELDARLELRGGRLVLSGATDVRMTDFGITPPSFLFGAMKTEDAIHLTFSLTLVTPIRHVN